MLDLVTGTGLAADPWRANAAFDAATDGSPTIVARYHESPTTDRFVNGWLLQLESVRSDEHIRAFSYMLDPETVRERVELVGAEASG